MRNFLRRIRDWFEPQPSGVQWGSYWIPHSRTNYNFLAAGAVGSGKTTLLRMLLRSVVPDVADDAKDVRVLLYDPKAQWLTELVDLGLSSQTEILNPFDARSIAWDMAADITTEAEARELATLFYPQSVGGENRFFYDAARKLVKAVFLAFITLYRSKKLGRPWQLRDILLACSNVADLSAIIKSAELPTDSLEDFLTAEKEARSVRMTVAVENEAYNAIAAAWYNATKDRPDRAKSLDIWAKGRAVWLLGESKRYRSALASVNRLMLQRLQQLTLEEVEKDAASGRRSWFVLDEFASLGRIPHIEELLTEGRERGTCVVLGFQHIAHIRDIYRGLTEAILGQCHHQAFFKANDAEMAQWCCERFPPIIDYLPDGYRVEKIYPSVLPSDFFDLHSASKEKGFTCIIRTDEDIADGPKRVNITPEKGPPPLKPVKPGDTVRARFVPRPLEELDLCPWTPAERKALNLSETQEPSRGLQFPALEHIPLDDVGTLPDWSDHG